MQVRIYFQNDNGYAISHMNVDLAGIDRDDWQTAIVLRVHNAHPMGCGGAGKYRVDWNPAARVCTLPRCEDGTLAPEPGVKNGTPRPCPNCNVTNVTHAVEAVC